MVVRASWGDNLVLSVLDPCDIPRMNCTDICIWWESACLCCILHMTFGYVCLASHSLGMTDGIPALHCITLLWLVVFTVLPAYSTYSNITYLTPVLHTLTPPSKLSISLCTTVACRWRRSAAALRQERFADHFGVFYPLSLYFLHAHCTCKVFYHSGNVMEFLVVVCGLCL